MPLDHVSRYSGASPASFIIRRDAVADGVDGPRAFVIRKEAICVRSGVGVEPHLGFRRSCRRAPDFGRSYRGSRVRRYEERECCCDLFEPSVILEVTINRAVDVCIVSGHLLVCLL
jgi:hypothetical protein